MNKKCLGCGAIMQTTFPSKEGYTSNIDRNICERCFRLTNYNEYQKVSLTNDNFLNILDNIPKDSLVVYLTSLLNINLDYLDKFSKVIIVLTKKDLLPKSVKDAKLINYISNLTNNYVDIEIISSIKNYHLDNLLNKIKKHSRNDREVYFVGMTNSGKSTLINKLIKNYGSGLNYVTTSLYPSTTLGIVKIDLGDLKIVDTPGLLSSGSILNSLSLKEMKKITPKKEIKPRSYQLKKSGALIIEDYVRLDYNIDNNITIYIANNLKVLNIKKSSKKLQEADKYSLVLKDKQDIVIEDLCFLKFTKACQVTIYTPYKVHIYTRDNLI